MEAINHECYVSLEVAKLLKEAGFDWKCNLYFSELNAPKEAGIFDAVTNKVYGCFDSTIPGIDTPTEDVILRPTLYVAQRWLREVKNCYLDVMVEDDVDDDGNITFDGFTAYYVFIGKPHGLADSDGVIYGNFDTYESALESGIKKALEIISEKGE